MKTSLRNLMAGLASATTLLLAACGGGGGGGSDAPPAVNPPVAAATATPTSGVIGTTITLDGSGSTTPNGGTLTYQWSLASQPGGSTAALSNSTNAKPTFVIDQPGEYVAALVVNDGRASSTAARVTIAGTTLVPVAVVTPQTQGVLLGATVTLDGSSSIPPTGVPTSELSYQWKLTAQPTDSTTALSGAASAKATFTADKVGIYRATLVVSHGDQASPAVEATVTVNTANSAPVISLNVPSTAVRGDTITLDGSASSDPDGDKLSYRWSFPRVVANSSNPPIPYGSRTTISNANSARAQLVPDAVGTYYIDFTVYDDSVATTQRVTINVTKPAGVPNSAPVAVIGTGNAALEYELGAYAAPNGTRSYDIDGDARTYKWTWWNTATPNDRKSGGTLYAATVGAQPAGTYQAELIVNDGQTDSAPVTETFTIKTGANVAPVASAKVNIARVLVGETLVFDGSTSSDRNGDPLSYRWTLIDRPAGSNAVVQNATSAQASVTADQPGVYIAQLQVADPKGAVSLPALTDTVSAFAKAKNNPPVVAKLWLQGDGTTDITPGQATYIPDSGPYKGTISLPLSFQAFDPDQDFPLYYIVTPTRQSAGSTLASVSGEAASGYMAQPVTYTFTEPGEYEFELTVSDGLANSAPQRRSLTVVNRADYPTLLLEYVALTGIGSTPAPDTPSSQRYFPFAQSGTDALVHWFRLTASDRDYTIADLTISSAQGDLLPVVTGLQNGQVIRQGQSVLFSYRRALLPNEAELAQRLTDISNSGGPDVNERYRSEQLRQEQLINEYQFKMSFRVLEKEGYTFSIGGGD